MPLAMLAAGIAMNCWVSSAQQFNLPPYLLYAMASVESSYNPDAIAHAPNGTHSVGLMQVNSRWFPELAKYGISEQQLHDPCTNVHVGAWILSQEVARYGYTWRAIGSYYAGPYKKELSGRKLHDYRVYSDKVLKRWRLAITGRLPITPPPLSRHPAPQDTFQYVGMIGSAAPARGE